MKKLDLKKEIDEAKVRESVKTQKDGSINELLLKHPITSLCQSPICPSYLWEMKYPLETLILQDYLWLK